MRRINSIVAALVLAACSKQAVDQPASAVAGAPPVNYWSVIAPLVAGKYGGHCLRPPASDAYAGAILVGSDGAVTAADVRSNLRQADIVLSAANDNGERSAGMNASHNDFTMMLADKGPARGLVSMVVSGDRAVTCEQDMAAPALRGLHVYAVIARFIDAPSHQLSCIATGALTQGTADFSLANGILTLHGERFDLHTSRTETALFTDGLSKLFYTSTLADGRVIKLNLDDHGKLAGIDGKGDGDQLYACK